MNKSHLAALRQTLVDAELWDADDERNPATDYNAMAELMQKVRFTRHATLADVYTGWLCSIIDDQRRIQQANAETLCEAYVLALVKTLPYYENSTPVIIAAIEKQDGEVMHA